MRITEAVRHYLTGIIPGSPSAYAIAFIFVSIVFAIRFFVGIHVEGVVPLSVFYPAVFLAAFVGGFGPGVFAVLLSAFLGWWAFMPPAFSFVLLKTHQLINVLYFLFGSMIVVWGTNFHRLVAKRLEEQERLRVMAVAELSHRLKNKLATLQTIINFQLREHPDLQKAINTRLNALAGTDDLLLQANGAGAHLRDIFSREAGPYDMSRTSISGPDVFLPPQLALLMTLSVHELCTNAAKYGCLSVPDGKLVVAWTQKGDELRLTWQETCGPAVSAPARTGFGTRLLTRALGSFGGKIDLAFQPTGLVVNMSLKVPRAASSLVPTYSPTSGDSFPRQS